MKLNVMIWKCVSHYWPFVGEQRSSKADLWINFNNPKNYQWMTLKTYYRHNFSTVSFDPTRYLKHFVDQTIPFKIVDEMALYPLTFAWLNLFMLNFFEEIYKVYFACSFNFEEMQKMFSILLALYDGNPAVTGGFSSQRASKMGKW